jgi:hypothetical protein
VHQDRGVRPVGAAELLVVDVVAGPVAVVGAHHQDVQRLLRPLHLLLGPVLELVGDVDDVEVAVEVAVEVDDAETGRERQRPTCRIDKCRTCREYAASPSAVARRSRSDRSSGRR